MTDNRRPRGNKRCYQVLLDPNRSILLDRLSEESGKKATALIRDAVYRLLRSKTPPLDYETALLKDESLWTDAVRTRVATGAKNREIRAQKYTEL